MPVLSRDVRVPASLRLHLPVVNKCALLLLEFFLVKDPQVLMPESLFSLITNPSSPSSKPIIVEAGTTGTGLPHELIIPVQPEGGDADRKDPIFKEKLIK